MGSTKRYKGIKAALLAVVSITMAVGGAWAVPKQANASDSAFNQRGTGILGWHATSYGGSFTEESMKANTDWIADNFKQYGYEYICVDGWVGDSTIHNSDGYITMYKNNWQHDWKYWADYVHSKGLKLGIYYNPAWLHQDLVKDDSLKIAGTDIPLRSLIVESPDNKYMHQTRYMINPDAPGAKEYAQGMIKYYISVGVDLIKIDFLRYYENVYGHEAVKKLYGWIREAAGDDIILYFANTNNVDHAADEVAAANILRASEDWRTNAEVPGVWYHTSVRNRGQVKDGGWPPAYNLFDGLIWFSDLSGPGKVVIDGDYSVLSSGGTDAEKKTRISLLAMAGSSINIGDRYSNIGDNGSYYTNPEILDMNKQGFVGKPLNRDVNSALSQIWKGRLPDGSWVAALFNREDTPQTRSIDFANDLGLHSGSYQVSDMWSHSSIGTMSSYSEEVEPHGVRLLKITRIVDIDSMESLIDQYVLTNELTGPLVQQLRNSLKQADHQLGKGDRGKAAKHMEDFLKHLENEAMQDHVSDAAKAALTADAEALIANWLS